jgi:hypothetical protein
MLAMVANDPDMREPLRQRFAPWTRIVERTVERALGDTPYAGLVPTHDLAFAITSLFIGLELMLNLEPETERKGHRVFESFELLGSMLQSLLETLPPPPDAG